MNKSRFFALFTVLTWATNSALVKTLLTDIPDMQALCISSFLAFAFLLIVNLKTGVLREMKKYSLRQYGYMAVLGFTGMFLYSALYYFGLMQMSAQEACIVNYLWPMMLVLFSCLLLKEKLTMMKIVSMVCSFIGIVILSSGSPASADGNRAAGILCCMLAAAFYGLFSVLNKKADYDQSLSMMVFWLTTALCALAAGLAGESWVPLGGVQWLGMLWLGAVINGAAYLTWALALKEADNTASVANLAYLTPFLSVVISAIFLNEGFQPRAFIALIFIVGGILLQSRFDRTPAH